MKDAAELSVKILDVEYKNKYIVLTGHEATRVRDMIEMIKEIMNKPIAVEYKNHAFKHITIACPKNNDIIFFNLIFF